MNQPEEPAVQVDLSEDRYTLTIRVRDSQGVVSTILVRSPGYPWRDEEIPGPVLGTVEAFRRGSRVSTLTRERSWRFGRRVLFVATSFGLPLHVVPQVRLGPFRFVWWTVGFAARIQADEE